MYSQFIYLGFQMKLVSPSAAGNTNPYFEQGHSGIFAGLILPLSHQKCIYRIRIYRIYRVCTEITRKYSLSRKNDLS